MCIVTPEEGFSSIVGQRTKVSISVKDCGPVTGATLLLTPTNGDTPLNLLDNGVSPDETANDGTYSANWNPQHAGSVTLHIVASGFGATLTGSISGDVGEAPRGGVLIAVDIAGSAGYWNPSPTYEDAITSAGYHVVETITASSEGDIPWPSPFTEAEYDAVVVLTGENWRAGPDNISPEDETALTHYLNTGGCYSSLAKICCGVLIRLGVMRLAFSVDTWVWVPCLKIPFVGFHRQMPLERPEASSREQASPLRAIHREGPFT
jgi:hypothetical protein